MKKKLIGIISICAAVSVFMTACGETSGNGDSEGTTAFYNEVLEGVGGVATDANGEPLVTYVATDADGKVVAWDYDKEVIEDMQRLIDEQEGVSNGDSDNVTETQSNVLVEEGKEIDGGFIADIYTDHAVITGYTGKTRSVEIPSEIEGVPVTAIASKAFYQVNTCTDIIIPEGVTYIGEYAFSEIPYLASVVLPESLTLIDRYAFGNCVALENVVIPEGVTEIGEKAFQDCPLTGMDLVIPSGCKKLGAYAFAQTSIASLRFAGDIEEIGGACFWNCSELSGEIIIPGSVKNVQAETFKGCEKVEKLVLSEGVETFDNSAFKEMYSLSEIELPSTLTSIVDLLGRGGFCKLDNLKTVTIPGSLTDVYTLFQWCDNLETIIIEEGVINIHDGFAKGCPNLKKVVIPQSVMTINDDSFADCSSLSEIDLSNVVSISDDSFVGSPIYDQIHKDT